MADNKVQELVDILVKHGGKKYTEEKQSEVIKPAFDAVKKMLNEITLSFGLEPKIVKYNKMNTSILKEELWFSYVLH